MADIAPFCGLRYNTEKISDLAQVVIPPYDVISPEEQELFHRLSPYNMVRLELGQKLPGDTEADNPHTRAASCLGRWIDEGIFQRDKSPALYYSEVDYTIPGGERRTRRGFVCALRLEEFGAGNVLPHEKTFSAVKAERLGLMKAGRANLSPVFAVYSDPGNGVDSALRGGRGAEPAERFVDAKGLTHRLWPVTDPEIIQTVQAAMTGKVVYIADGHHRYETALNYRNLQRSLHPEAGSDAAFEYVMMYLSCMNHEGLTILPTHRLLKDFGGVAPEEFARRAEAFFEVSRFDGSNGGADAWMTELEAGAARRETVIGFCHADTDAAYILKVKQESASAYLDGVPEILANLDVVVLDRVILQGMLGLSESFLADSNNIHFKHDAVESLEAVRSGNYKAGFILNSTRIDQVQGVAGAGLIMPHKSTYFYPKVGSGLVVNTLEPDRKMSV